ncbi:MAG: biotin synthase BioB [Phycisphaerae bacterium]
MRDFVTQLAHKVLAGQQLTREDARQLAGVTGDDVYDLFYWANKIRIQFKGRDVRFCAIVAAKAGGCSEDCKFCAQSSHYATTVQGQVKLTDEEVLRSAEHAADVGADSFGIVNSGRAPTRKELEEWLAPLLRKIAKDGKTRACATLGALTPETAKFLYDNGVRRINHNIETSARHYPQIVTSHPFSERLRTLKIAKAAGLSLCSGGIFGMGEDWEDRIDMALTLRELGVDVIPLNFLNAIAGTPLGDLPQLAPMECLKIISLFRFLAPTAELKVAGGREVCLRDLQSWIFYAGADSTMIGNYLTTYGRKPEADHQMVRDLGLGHGVYEEGAVEAHPTATTLPRVTRSGQYGIPILLESETTARPETVGMRG